MFVPVHYYSLYSLAVPDHFIGKYGGKNVTVASIIEAIQRIRESQRKC